MSIKPLPTDTRRLIGATSLIASPACLVRELVDNAIDARASCVDVLVSRNTVDKVEVRDNGTGIAPADFAVLGRPAHSSKREPSGKDTKADADADGPPSLGFRGEGLASANSLGFVATTTRTRADAVATTFRLVPKVGGIAPDSQRAAPAPPGTTMTVTCLFSMLPVRRKAALQDATKTMAAIKTLLCGYALAQPDLRLSLKVLQPGGGSATTAAAATAPFYYRPAPVSTAGHVGMKQAVSILFGPDVARQCRDVVASSTELLPQTTHADFVFDAWLPQPGANVAKLKLGSFVSVDGRPLSDGTYGSTAHKLAAIFNKAFGASSSQGLFFRLNIQCPPGSYDANVAPSKTDVLFAEEHLVCEAFARLCQTVYEQQPPISSSPPVPSSVPMTPLPSQRTRNGDDNGPVRIQIGTIRHGNRRHLASAPRQRAVRSLQTPPSSPLGGRQSQGSPYPDLPGLVSGDGFRQTTISFHGPRASARDARRQPQVELSVPPVQPANRVSRTAQSTTPQIMPAQSRSPQIMAVDLRQLRRSAARLARHVNAWEREEEMLPEMAGIASIETRLRATIAAWLATTRAGEDVPVELYLRKSLKQKALTMAGDHVR